MKRIVRGLLAVLLISGCSFPTNTSGDTPPAPTEPPPPASPTEPPIAPSPTAEPPTATPLPLTITAETVAGLSPFLTFAEGELVRALAFSPDGGVLAAAVGDEAGTIRLYEAATGLPLRDLEGHESIVWGLAFSPDGALLASVARDHTAKIWDWRAGSLVHSLDFPDEVVSVAFSPDNQSLAVGGVDEWPNAAIWIYGVDAWQLRMRLAEFWNIPDMAFTADGALLVGGGTSRNVRVWRTSDGAEVRILYHPGQVSSIAISPDGSAVATGLCEASDEASQCVRGAVWLRDLVTGRLIRQLSDFPEGVEGVAFSPDGSIVLAASRGGTVRAYATSDHRSLLAAMAPPGPSTASILALALSPDGRYLATGGVGAVSLWRVQP
jgi:WD40 repeat protein